MELVETFNGVSIYERSSHGAFGEYEGSDYVAEIGDVTLTSENKDSIIDIISQVM